MNAMVTDFPENMTKGIDANVHWSLWLPDLDHNSCASPDGITRTITFNAPILVLPFI